MILFILCIDVNLNFFSVFRALWFEFF